MKTLHLSIIVIIGITIAGIFYFTTASADSINIGGPSQPVNFQLSQIVASGNNVYVVYQSNTYPEEIFFRKSTDEGTSFDKIIKINNDNGSVSDPQIAASGNNVYVGWFASYLNGTTHVLFKKSTDTGNTFGNAIVLDPNVTKGSSFISQMVASGSNVYVVMNYNNFTSLRFSQIFRASTDNGDTFGKPVLLVNEGSSIDTKIAASENNIYVIWQYSAICPQDMCNQSDIVFRKSTDNGTTFGKMINLSNGVIAIFHQMATSKNNVFVVWQDGQYPNIFFTKSSDDGSTFSNRINLSKKVGESGDSQVAVEGNNVYVAFYHYNDTNSYGANSSQGVYFTKSSDGGNTFGNPIKIANNWAPFFHIATSEKNVYVIWNDINPTSSREDIFFTKSIDNGTTFDNAIDLSSGIEGNSNVGQIAVEGKNVYVGWGAGRPGNDIYFRASADNGRTFGNVINLNHENESITKSTLQEQIDLAKQKTGDECIGGPGMCPAEQKLTKERENNQTLILVLAIGIPTIAASVIFLIWRNRKQSRK
jgi:hypothetical protein